MDFVAYYKSMAENDPDMNWEHNIPERLYYRQIYDSLLRRSDILGPYSETDDIERCEFDYEFNQIFAHIEHKVNSDDGKQFSKDILKNIANYNITHFFSYIVVLGKDGIEDYEKFYNSLYQKVISEKYKRKFVIRLYKILMSKAFEKTHS